MKFNEQCFVRLLGGMCSCNYIIVVTQDFDQQRFEKRHKIYLPQFYVDNVFYVEILQRAIPLENYPAITKRRIV